MPSPHSSSSRILSSPCSCCVWLAGYRQKWIVCVENLKTLRMAQGARNTVSELARAIAVTGANCWPSGSQVLGNIFGPDFVTVLLLLNTYPSLAFSWQAVHPHQSSRANYCRVCGDTCDRSPGLEIKRRQLTEKKRERRQSISSVGIIEFWQLEYISSLIVHVWSPSSLTPLHATSFDSSPLAYSLRLNL
jgi:hypothetical protein